MPHGAPCEPDGLPSDARTVLVTKSAVVRQSGGGSDHFLPRRKIRLASRLFALAELPSVQHHHCGRSPGHWRRCKPTFVFKSLSRGLVAVGWFHMRAMMLAPFLTPSGRVPTRLLDPSPRFAVAALFFLPRDMRPEGRHVPHLNCERHMNALRLTEIEIFHAAFESSPRRVARLSSACPVEEALEQAYKGTQNVDSSWVESKGQLGVRIEPDPTVATGCRSTSTGDYARVVDVQGLETFWRCCFIGWRPIQDRSDIDLVGMPVIAAGHSV